MVAVHNRSSKADMAFIFTLLVKLIIPCPFLRCINDSGFQYSYKSVKKLKKFRTLLKFYSVNCYLAGIKLLKWVRQIRHGKPIFQLLRPIPNHRSLVSLFLLEQLNRLGLLNIVIDTSKIKLIDQINVSQCNRI